jgi:predicted DNA-binding WGR domain protein
MQIDMKRIDPELNMDRFYCVELEQDLFDDHRFHRQWGRRGSWGSHRRDWYETKLEAQNAMSKLVKQKLARGYTLNEPINANQLPSYNNPIKIREHDNDQET